jgi:hypothetical protein
MARDVACEWLRAGGYAYDVAVDPPFTGGLDWRTTRPDDYTHVVFVCGPFQRGLHEDQFVKHFRCCRLVGLDLSVLVPPDEWNPFHVLLERDSSATSRPDIAFLSRQTLVPVVGRCLVEDYPNSRCDLANAAIARLLADRECAIVEIDTRLDINAVGLRTPAEIESLIARVDVLVSTRLHGLMFALKNGVPALVVDPMGDGAKILKQAKTIGWPFAFPADTVTDRQLREAFEYCLTGKARVQAAECGAHAKRTLLPLQQAFLAALQ